ncbi:helix-turn-helix domain-containing protein [Nakamurella aerolata]|uniref:Helix-turn-helix domain-containing protein n=1 Tax=Nakamurella aerolata TaxID=1656892 RepID=A0A849ADC2_9ACTN|nr:helix-turn-helix transcriptional regulator [Nakamurella aerolata]NNG36470.1 helix-turn-helix domain-containing protein [Nakamurella aerolata]
MSEIRPGGDLLRQRRRAAGLSQQQLAAVAGVSVRTVRNLENGSHSTRPFPATIAALGDALRMSLEERAALLDSWNAANSSKSFADLDLRLAVIIDALRASGVANNADYRVLHRTRRIKIGSDRTILWQTEEQLVVANNDGVQRLFMLFPSDPSFDPADMAFSEVESCGLDQRLVQDVLVVEIDLGQPLATGEQRFMSFRADTHRPGPLQSSRGRTLQPQRVVTSGFRRGVDSLVIHVQFDGPRPEKAWTLVRPGPTATDELTPVELDSWGGLTMAGQDLPPATYGLRWEW